MKILFVTTIANTVNLFLIPHLKFLIEQGNEVGVAFNSDDISPELMNLTCKIHPIEFNRNPLKKENLSAYKKIKQIVTKEGYELIHVHTPVASFITRLACRKLKNIRIFYTVHGFHFFKGAPIKNWAIYYTLERLSAKWTDGLITMNQEDFRIAKGLKFRKPDCIFQVHGVGLDLTKFTSPTIEEKYILRNEYNYRLEDFILIYVGELSFRKHQDLLIKAVSILKDKIPNLKLLLIGSGPLENSYKEMVNRLGIKANIEFLGYREDISELMKIADAAVSTSRQEGLPVNVMEAMATGLPLVATNVRGNRDLVVNEVNGLLCSVEDAEGCAGAIERLYKSEQLRREFSLRNKEMIQSYSIHHVLKEMKEIYEKQFIC
ncbi:glycosyltransferase family 4 protein [Cytobacillus massiliigabonensis]|uniref:glycosyltransferase family 4 protein n=1 Tax=Cytobacillus massiliigabonensis TaxID=1871011 RepID=UPI000C86412B|nr:glycosyltransferase family 4 protein [Cytobacillus massiliigabonensis]